MPHLKVYESKVSFCAWDKIYLLLNCVPEPETIVQSPLQSPMWKSYLWTVWPPVRRRGRRQRSPHLMPNVNGVRLPIWNLVSLGKVGIMLLTKWQVYVKQISRYRFRRSRTWLSIDTRGTQSHLKLLIVFFSNTKKITLFSTLTGVIQKKFKHQNYFWKNHSNISMNV